MFHVLNPIDSYIITIFMLLKNRAVNICNLFIMKYFFSTLTGRSALVVLVMVSCHSNRSGNSGLDAAVIEAEKPAVDSSKIIELVDLYRAKRYEDLQTAHDLYFEVWRHRGGAVTDRAEFDWTQSIVELS